MPMHSSLGLSVCHVCVSIHHEWIKNTSYGARHISGRCSGGYFIVIAKSLGFSVKVEDWVENISQPYYFFTFAKRNTVQLTNALNI